ncbi:hypothetical protein T439DRAFT_321006 [Meredithblackwellia eburnea MCA 4105]
MTATGAQNGAGAGATPVRLQQLFDSVATLTPSKRQSSHERLTFILLALVGSKVTVTVKNGQQFSGILASTTSDSDWSVALRQAQQIVPPGTDAPPVQPRLVVLARDLVQLDAQDVSIDTRPVSNSSPFPDSQDSFKTDTDISRLETLAGGADRRVKELQAWGGGAPSATSSASGVSLSLDDGPGNSSKANQWDQFAANERLYGTTTNYDEEIYTTKLDRSTADYQAKERRAAQLEKEILKGGTLSNNIHVQEERGTLDDSVNEEDRYGAVVRGPGAYVPPGARRQGVAGAATARLASSTNGSSPAPSSGTMPKAQEPPAVVIAPATTADRTPISTSRSPVPVAAPVPPGSTSKQPVVSPPTVGSTPDHETVFRNFVHSEKVKLNQKREEAVKAQERKEQDSKIASLTEWSKNFKLPMALSEDLLHSIGRDKSKLPSASTATSPVQSPIRPPRTLTPAVNVSSTPSSAAATAGTPTSAKTTPRTSPSAKIAEIPPFRPKNVSASASAVASPSPAAATLPKPTTGTPLVPKAPGSLASKLHANAPAFKPFNPNAASFTPSFATASPVPKPAAPPANPFFGNKQLKKGSASMHVKEDFTPFKSGLVVEPAKADHQWHFTGKPFRSMFPPENRVLGPSVDGSEHGTPQPQPQQITPHPQGPPSSLSSASQTPQQQPPPPPGSLPGGLPPIPPPPLMQMPHLQHPHPPQGFQPMYGQFPPNFNPRFPPNQQPPQGGPQQLGHLPPPPPPGYNPFPLGFQGGPQGPHPGGPMFPGGPSPQMAQQQPPFLRYNPQFGQNGVPLGFQGGPPPSMGAGP